MKHDVFSLKKNESKGVQKKKSFSIDTIALFIERYLLQVDIAHTSRITYQRGLAKFSQWVAEHKEAFGDTPLAKEHIVAYKSFLESLSLSTYTRSLYLVCVRQFFAWCESVLIYPNITKGIRHIKCKTKSHCKDSLTRKQAALFLRSMEGGGRLHDLRDRCLITLLLYTGLRLTEVKNILLKDIEFQDTTSLVWVRGKGREGKDAFVVLMPEVLVEMKRYLQERFSEERFCDDAYLFVSHGAKQSVQKKMSTESLSRIIKNRMIAAGIKTKRLTAHSLRHTFGVFAIQGGASLYEVQLAMRHSSPVTTQIYLGDIETLKRKEAGPEKTVSAWLKKSEGK